MDCINQIKEKLKKYPDLKWELDGSTISVSPDNGFTVWLVESEHGCTVGYNGWHEEFLNKNEALNCFAFGLSEQCRLKVFIKGNTEYKWIMEAFEDGSWVSYGTTGIFFYPYWRKRKLVDHYNHYIAFSIRRLDIWAVRQDQQIIQADCATRRRLTPALADVCNEHEQE